MMSEIDLILAEGVGDAFGEGFEGGGFFASDDVGGDVEFAGGLDAEAVGVGGDADGDVGVEFAAGYCLGEVLEGGAAAADEDAEARRGMGGVGDVCAGWGVMRAPFTRGLRSGHPGHDEGAEDEDPEVTPKEMRCMAAGPSSPVAASGADGGADGDAQADESFVDAGVGRRGHQLTCMA